MLVTKYTSSFYILTGSPGVVHEVPRRIGRFAMLPPEGGVFATRRWGHSRGRRLNPPGSRHQPGQVDWLLVAAPFELQADPGQAPVEVLLHGDMPGEPA